MSFNQIVQILAHTEFLKILGIVFFLLIVTKPKDMKAQEKVAVMSSRELAENKLDKALLMVVETIIGLLLFYVSVSH